MAQVGFAVPVKTMIEGPAALGGLAFGILPGILCKVAAGGAARMPYRDARQRELAARASPATCGGAIQPIQYLVGCAMVPRGEFAFLVASQAYSLKVGDTAERMMSEGPYAQCVWGLVWALVGAPFLFKWALGVYQKASPVERSSDTEPPTPCPPSQCRATHPLSVLGRRRCSAAAWPRPCVRAAFAARILAGWRRPGRTSRSESRASTTWACCTRCSTRCTRRAST